MIKLLESENFEAATNDMLSDLTKTHHAVVPIAHPKIQCHKELDDNGINTTIYIATDANMPLRIILFYLSSLILFHVCSCSRRIR